MHYALEAWLHSLAYRHGIFVITGRFIPRYAEKLSSMLARLSVQVLGYRKDVPELMRKSDIRVLPSIEEGSALVTSEARGCGCMLPVSEAAGAICSHTENALVHPIGDIKTLPQHITLPHDDRALLERLRSASLTTAHEVSWTAAGRSLLSAYHTVRASARRYRRDPSLCLICSREPRRPGA